MHLVAVKTQNYKCILDSGWFELDELTALVGKNESGKTALLESLEKINAADPSRAAFRDNDFPRILSQDGDPSEGGRVAVESRWELSEAETKQIDALCGVPILMSRTVVYRRGYGELAEWEVQLDYKAAVEHLVACSGLDAPDRNAVKASTNVEQLIRSLRALTEPSPRQTTFLTELQTRFPNDSLRAAVTVLLKGWLPRFVYYSSYDRLPGRVSMTQLVQMRAGQNVQPVPGAKVFTALLSMVDTTPETIQSIGQSEDLISKLESVQARISRRVFKYWSQNHHLKVRFDYRQASPNDPPPFNSGSVFQTRIENQRHEATINLDERSTGFIWFFSFLVWFSEVTREYGDSLVVLLDEPGLSLHGRAQFDLLRFIKEELLPKYQVVYTTHSPFMVDSADLLSCRTVEDVVGEGEEVLGTKVRADVLATDRDTLFPLQAALGYDITQSLFVGEHSLLVEGPSDLLFMQWASSELQEARRVGLDPRWTVTPCGGLAKVSSFVALFGGNKLHVAVLTDYGAGDRTKVRDLRESALLRDGHVFSADMYVAGASEADIEDVLGRAFYVDLTNAAYKLTGSNRVPIQQLAGASVRVTAEVKSHFDVLPATVPEYDHFKPAEYLFREGADPAWRGKAEALDRFEKLFQDLNAII